MYAVMDVNAKFAPPARSHSHIVKDDTTAITISLLVAVVLYIPVLMCAATLCVKTAVSVQKVSNQSFLPS